VYTPNSWTAQQVNTMADMLVKSPQAVFTPSFLAAYPDITGITVTPTSLLPSVPSAGGSPSTTRTATSLSKSAQIGVGVGVGVGGGLLLAGAAVGVMHLRRRRRAAIEPRNELGAEEVA
jgi:hypothetical protein